MEEQLTKPRSFDAGLRQDPTDANTLTPAEGLRAAAPATVANSATSWFRILASIAGCTLAAFALYFATVTLLIDPYVLRGSDAGRVLGVWRAYERIQGEQASASGHHIRTVLFWGSSMIREAVDTRLVTRSAPGLLAYNLGVSGDIPNRRLVELPRVQELRPDHVVIGVSYRDVFNSGRVFEDQIAVLPREAFAQLPADTTALLDERARAAAARTDWQRLWWKRKFTLSAVFWKLGVPDRSNPIPEGFAGNFICPNVYSRSLPEPELKQFLADRGRKYPPYSDAAPLDLTNNTAVTSLHRLVAALTAQGSTVTLVNMPLHPLLNELIPATRRASYLGFLRSLANPQVELIDLQAQLPAAQFIDLLHLNASGRESFTTTVAASVKAQAGLARRSNTPATHDPKSAGALTRAAPRADAL